MTYNGGELARMRVDAGLTQREAAARLARRLGRPALNWKSLSNIECGWGDVGEELIHAMAVVYKRAVSAVRRAVRVAHEQRERRRA